MTWSFDLLRSETTPLKVKGTPGATLPTACNRFLNQSLPTATMPPGIGFLVSFLL